MRTDYWNIKLDGDEDYNREQAWASLKQIRERLAAFQRRTRSGYAESPHSDVKSSLTKDEGEDIRAIDQRLRRLEIQIHDHETALDQIAAVVSEPKSKWGTALHDVVNDYHGDVEVYVRRGGDKTLLALALMEEDGLDSETIHDFIHNSLQPDSRYARAWTCPRCEGACYLDASIALDPRRVSTAESIRKGRPECARCYGWGYVFTQPEKDDIDDGLSQTGKLARNRGEDWTEEQESAEQARLATEEDDE